jgi:NTP pyrophosphatase (non-canonical NTP hydrolase)
MTNEEYVKNAIRTESPPDKAQERLKQLSQGEIKLLRWKLEEAIKVINDLDKWKKFIFYGKALPDELSTKGKVFTRDYEEPIKLSEKEIRVLHSAIGITTESGELLEAIKKVIVEDKELDVVNVAEEFSDCEWYLAILSDAIEVSHETVMEKNIAKLKARYPDKFTEEKAINRDLNTERKILEA